jgi:hypothetical protein
VEIWRDVPGFGGFFQASSLGRIRSKERKVFKRHYSGKVIEQVYRERVLLQSDRDDFGHKVVHVSINGKKMNVSVHRFVLLAFVGEPENGMVACHNNGNANDNRPENLRWDTQYENNQDRKSHGRYNKGEHHHEAKIRESNVLEIRNWRGKKKDALEKFGISHSQYYRIRNAESWKHI